MAGMTASARADDEPRGELAWFRHELGRALWQPRAFARSLAREHYGIAGMFVSLAAGFALSLSIDSLVLTSRGLDPLRSVTLLVMDAVALALRLTITVTAIAAATYGALWIVGRRRTALSLDQIFTAIAFALVPLVLLPSLALVLGIASEMLVPVAAFAALLLLRLIAGLVLNLRAVLPPALAVAALALVSAGAWITLPDQVARVHAIAYLYAPTLAPPLPAASPLGERFEGDSWSLVLPPRWRNATGGVVGEAARFVTDSDTLVVARVQGSVLLTAEEFAGRVATSEGRGVQVQASERTVWRSGELIVIDERMRGRYDGRAVLLRQFTAVRGSQVMALVFRFIEPSDERALLAESASIAAGWRLAPQP